MLFSLIHLSTLQRKLFFQPKSLNNLQTLVESESSTLQGCLTYARSPALTRVIFTSLRAN